MNIRKWKIIVVAAVWLGTLTIPVLAYEYFFRTPNYQFNSGIILQTYPTPTMQLGFYLDAACTQPVNYIDFGEMIHPNQVTMLSIGIYIRNEGSQWNAIYWNSTLGSVTMQIADRWSHQYYGGPYWDNTPLNGTTLQSGGVQLAFYMIRIPAYTAVGTYNWTLTAWGKHWY